MNYLFNGCRVELLDSGPINDMYHVKIFHDDFWIPAENLSVEAPDETVTLKRMLRKEVAFIISENTEDTRTVFGAGTEIAYYGHYFRDALISVDGIKGLIDDRGSLSERVYNPWGTEEIIPKGLFSPEEAIQIAIDGIIEKLAITEPELRSMHMVFKYRTYVDSIFKYDIRFYPDYPDTKKMYFASINAETGKLWSSGYDDVTDLKNY